MIIFRTDAGPQLGFGHLTRCRALAMALRQRGQCCVMVGPDTSYAKTVDPDIFEDWVAVSDWLSSQEDAARVISLAQQHRAGWVVLDDYRIEETYQLSLRAAGLRWLQFDGSASKPLWADVVVNANPATSYADYAAVLWNPNTRLLLGPKYAILRPEFVRTESRDPARPVKQILVTFGGGDDRGANEFVLSTLLPVSAPNQHFLVLSGATNTNNPSLKQWIETYGQGRVSLHVEPELVAPLFASSDLAVMAGGTSTYEAACCGLPMILITTADNQIPQSKAWAELGTAVHLGRIGQVDGSELVDGYQTITNDHSCRTTMADMGRKVVTGNGAACVAEIIDE